MTTPAGCQLERDWKAQAIETSKLPSDLAWFLRDRFSIFVDLGWRRFPFALDWDDFLNALLSRGVKVAAFVLIYSTAGLRQFGVSGPKTKFVAGVKGLTIVIGVDVELISTVYAMLHQLERRPFELVKVHVDSVIYRRRLSM